MPRPKPAPPADPPPDGAATHFVVERLNWRRDNRGAFRRYPGATRLASFPDPIAAATFAREHESRARAVVNPFEESPAAPADQTAMPEPVFLDWLRDHDIEPPAVNKKTGEWGWEKWWDRHAKAWPADRLAAVWEVLDRVRFYRVTERPVRPVVYAVVSLVWGYNDEWYYPGDEGGVTQTVYRSRESAQKECDRQNRAERRQWAAMTADATESYERYPFDMEGRMFPGQDPFGPPVQPQRESDDEDEGAMFGVDEVPFCEVIELEWEGPA